MPACIAAKALENCIPVLAAIGWEKIILSPIFCSLFREKNPNNTCQSNTSSEMISSVERKILLTSAPSISSPIALMSLTTEIP